MMKILLMVNGIMAAISSAQKSANQEWKLSSDSKIKWSEECDFASISSYDTVFEIKSPEKCQSLCLADKRCTYFTHEKPLGGICYLKSSNQVLKEKGVESANHNTACGYVIHRKFQQEKKRPSEKEWRDGGNGTFKWRVGCDYDTGHQIETVAMKEHKGCGSLCFSNRQCTHFSHSNSKCYLIMLHGNQKPVYKKSEGICGFIRERKLIKKWKSSRNGRIHWATKCDFPAGTNLGITMVYDQSKCEDKCLVNTRCTHFIYWGIAGMKGCVLKEIRGEVVETSSEWNRLIETCGYVLATAKNSSKSTTQKKRIITTIKPLKSKTKFPTSPVLNSTATSKISKKFLKSKTPTLNTTSFTTTRRLNGTTPSWTSVAMNSTATTKISKVAKP